MTTLYHIQIDQWKAQTREESYLTAAARRKLRKIFDEAKGDNEVLGHHEFLNLLKIANLPAAKMDSQEKEKLFYEVAEYGGCPDSINFASLVVWVSESDNENAEILEIESDASFYAGLARAATSMTRPLAQSVTAVMQLLIRKASLTLAKYISNPVRLFKKSAVGTLEVISRKRGSLSTASALRAELAAGGVSSIAKLAVGPYMYNSIVSLTMFHTYSTTKEYLHLKNSNPTFKEAVSIELLCGGFAGFIQALLNTPAYNVKRIEPGKPLFKGCQKLLRKDGLRGLFKDMPLMTVQEVCGLASFFASYEFYKHHILKYTPDDHRLAGCVFAGMSAGMTLTAVSHPFDNLHEWHITNRHSQSAHSNAFIHFIRQQSRKSKAKILFRGLSRRLPLGIPAGIPLLVYEVFLGQDALNEQVDSAKG